MLIPDLILISLPLQENGKKPSQTDSQVKLLTLKEAIGLKSVTKEKQLASEKESWWATSWGLTSEFQMVILVKHKLQNA